MSHCLSFKAVQIDDDDLVANIAENESLEKAFEAQD